MNPTCGSLSTPLAWPSDIMPGAIDELLLEQKQIEKPDPKLKDGGIAYIW